MASSSSAPRPRRTGRKLLIVLLALVALVVIVLALLPYVISLESFKAQIEARAEQALGRPVDIGQVQLQILTGLGAGLEDLVVYNPPGWQEEHFVRVGTLSIKVAFLPLLQRQVEISKIVLSHGTIFVERDEAGRMNYADLVEPQPDGAPAGPSQDTTAEPSPLGALLVSEVTLQGVDVTFIDRQAVPGQTVTTTARDLQADLANIALNTPIDFDIATALLTDGEQNVRLRGQLGPVPESLAFDRVPLDVTLKAEDVRLDRVVPYMGPDPAVTAGQLGADVALKGTLESGLDLTGSVTIAEAQLPDAAAEGKTVTLPVVSLQHNIHVNLSQSVMQVHEVRLDLEPLQLTLGGTISQLTSTPQVDLQLTSNQFDPGQVAPKFPMLAEALPESTAMQGQVKLQGTVKGTPGNLQAETQLVIDAFSVQSGAFRDSNGATPGILFETSDTEVQSTTRLVSGRQPDVQVEVQSQRLVFDQRAGTEQPAASPPQDGPPQPSSQPLAPPVNLRGTAAIAEGRVKGWRFRQLTADFSLIDGLLKSAHAFQTFEGKYTGNIEANLAQAQPQYTVDARLVGVNVGNLVNELTPVENVLLGALDTTINLSGKGVDWEAISQTLTGDAGVQITSLKLTTLDLMPKLAATLQAVGTVAGFTVPEGLAQRSFDTLKAALHVAEGKIQTDDLQLSGQDLLVLAGGLVGLDQSLDLEGRAFLLGDLAAAFGEKAAFLQDQQGRIQLPFTLQGTITQPRVTPNERYLVELAKQSLLGEAGERAEEQLKKLLPPSVPGASGASAGPDDASAAQELQKKLFPTVPGQSPSPEPESKQEEEPQDTLRKTLKGLFNR